MASHARDWWRRHRPNKEANRSFIIPSPNEPDAAADAIAQYRASMARNCTEEGVRAGTRAAATACVLTAIPTLIGARVIPWAKSNLNYTAQALIISAATIAAYFVVADKTILECARSTSYERIQAERAAANTDA